MRDRIVKAAVRLGFDLEGGRRPKIIAFLLSNRGVLHPFHSTVLTGAEAYCGGHDYGLLFLSLQYSTAAPATEVILPEILQQRQVVSGVIVAGTNSPSLLEQLTRRGMPWVVLGNNVIGEWSEEEGGVFFDDVAGAYELTRYLQSLGHREIGFSGNLHLPWYARRFQGFGRAMAEAGLNARLSEVTSENSYEMGYVSTKLLLRESPRPTAIFAGDDAAARGAYQAARDCALAIPDDLSIAGFNDTPEAATLHPPLTSVRVFTDEIGKQMAKLLLKRIARQDLAVRSITLPTQLVQRGSCGAPPANGEPSVAPHRAASFRQVSTDRGNP
jgi:DNA-binding LacI/PurR family transcriptional regulator